MKKYKIINFPTDAPKLLILNWPFLSVALVVCILSVWSFGPGFCKFVDAGPFVTVHLMSWYGVLVSSGFSFVSLLFYIYSEICLIIL